MKMDSEGYVIVFIPGKSI